MRIDEVLQRIQGEFVEMPGLRLTAAQAQRLWGLERDTCDALLGALVDAKFLSQTRDGAFVRLDGAAPTRVTNVRRGQTLAVA
jgi:Fic family protein